MNSIWLLFFFILGGVLAVSLIHGWGSLMEHLPLKKRPLKCLMPYVPASNRTGADGTPSTPS